MGKHESHTGQIAVKGLLPGVASHVRLECVTACMRESLAIATPPLARVLLLAVLNVRVVDVLDKLVHVALVTGRTAVPVANGDLILEVFFV